MTHKWNEDTTLKFVEEYRQYKCLWNLHYNLYKNKQACDAAYTSIASAMNIPDFGIAEVKTKIKNLRSTYSQELKKIECSKKSGAGTDYLYTPQVKWFKEMEAFLQGTGNKRKTHDNVNLVSIDIILLIR